jgi:hypothetical protein
MRATTVGSTLRAKSVTEAPVSPGDTDSGRSPKGGKRRKPLFYRVKKSFDTGHPQTATDRPKGPHAHNCRKRARPHHRGESRAPDAPRHFWTAHRLFRRHLVKPHVPLGRRLQKNRANPRVRPTLAAQPGRQELASTSRCGRSTARSGSASPRTTTSPCSPRRSTTARASQRCPPSP